MLIASLVVLAGVVVGPELLAAVDSVILRVREAGPVVFFGAMAVLPAVGFPMIAFTLAAGPVFGPTLGTGWVIACAVAAVVINLLLTYWLADRAVRPLVGRLLTCFDVRLPDRVAVGAWQLTLIVRLAPGLPCWVQSYSLGLMHVPLLAYMIVSTVVMTGYVAALVCGGEAVASGNGRLAFIAIGTLVVSIVLLRLLRRRTLRLRSFAPLAPLSVESSS